MPLPHGNDRERLRDTFDEAADLYQRARPDYPGDLFDELVNVTNISGGDPLLEVGCATGKATLPLAKRGFKITCIEPGPRLAAVARTNLRGFDVEVIEERFEAWTPPEDQLFDLVFAATSWHWIDPAIRYAKASEVLRPGGHLAFWDAVHVFPEGGDTFFSEIQDVYEEIGEGFPPDADRPRPGELKDRGDEITATGMFDVVVVRHFDWQRDYDAAGYIDLLETFSGHIAMEDWKRERLYEEIRSRLARRDDGLLRRHWGGVLHIAQRRG